MLGARGLLLALALALGSSALAQTPSAVASSEGLVTVVRSNPEPLPVFLEALARTSGRSVVVLPGVPRDMVGYQFTRLPWVVAWRTTLAAHGLAFCETPQLIVVGPAEAVERSCRALGVPVVTPGAPPPAPPSAPPVSSSEPLAGMGVRLELPALVVPSLPEPDPAPVAVVAPPAATPAPAPVLPQRYGVRVRLLEIADNSASAGGVDWSGNLLSSLIGAGVSALTGGAFVPSDLSTKVSALEQRGLARKLDDVRLVLTSGKPTVFRSGGTLQLSLIGSGEAKVERTLQYGLTLNLQPVTLEDGSVSLDVVADLSSPSSTTNPALLDLTTRSVTSAVTVRRGGGVVVAAFTSVRDESTGAGLPGVSGVPVVGWLAGRASTSAARSTVVVTLELEG